MGDRCANRAPSNRHFAFLELPPEIQERILVITSTNSVKDMCHAKMTCKKFKKLLESPSFYKQINLMYMYRPRQTVNFIPMPSQSPGWLAFKRKCYSEKNVTAILLKGMSEFMYGIQQAGIDDIKRAADEGSDLAKYCYCLIRKVMWIDGVDKGPISEETREFCLAVSTSLKKGGRPSFWGWNSHSAEDFCIRFSKVDVSCMDTCKCGIQKVPHLGIDIDYTDVCDRCFWQTEAWNFFYKAPGYFPLF